MEMPGSCVRFSDPQGNLLQAHPHAKGRVPGLTPPSEAHKRGAFWAAIFLEIISFWRASTMAFWLISVLLCPVQSLAYRTYSISNGWVLGATQNPLLTLSQGIQIDSSASILQK